jgi:signal transduction histidine kinase
MAPLSSGDGPGSVIERLRILLELTSDDIWECDAELRLTMVQGKITDQRGALGALLGRQADEFLDPTLPAEDFPRLRAAVEARQPFRNCAFPVRASGGEPEWVRMSGHPLFTSDGRFAGYLGTSTLITEERHRLAAERRRQQLESLGQLAGGVAHEFNNLLVPITMLSKLSLSQIGDSQPLRMYLETIHENGWKAAQIVRSVLTYARQMTPSTGPVACGEVIAERVHLLRQALPPSVVIDADISDCTTKVLGNASELSQIVVNLFNNACDAMSEYGKLRCSVQRASLAPHERSLNGMATSEVIRIEIGDTGPGIPADIRDRIFEPFFTTKPVGQGTGLGLSVVEGIVKDWGGHIAVTSLPGKGATFTILLPVAESGPGEP